MNIEQKARSLDLDVSITKGKCVPKIYCKQDNFNFEIAAFSFGPRREKTCLRGFANNTGADQPAHPNSLISAFVIHFLESIISRLTTNGISTF